MDSFLSYLNKPQESLQALARPQVLVLVQPQESPPQVQLLPQVQALNRESVLGSLIKHSHNSVTDFFTKNEFTMCLPAYPST